MNRFWRGFQHSILSFFYINLGEDFRSTTCLKLMKAVPLKKGFFTCCCFFRFCRMQSNSYIALLLCSTIIYNFQFQTWLRLQIIIELKRMSSYSQHDVLEGYPVDERPGSQPHPERQETFVHGQYAFILHGLLQTIYHTSVRQAPGNWEIYREYVIAF